MITLAALTRYRASLWRRITGPALDGRCWRRATNDRLHQAVSAMLEESRLLRGTLKSVARLVLLLGRNAEADEQSFQPDRARRELLALELVIDAPIERHGQESVRARLLLPSLINDSESKVG